MKISAKNQLKGRVVKITNGAVNSEVLVEVSPGTFVTSVITRSSAEELAIDTGTFVTVVIKASNVMLAVET